MANTPPPRRGAERLQPNRQPAEQVAQTPRGAKQHKVESADHRRSWLRHNRSVGRDAFARLWQTPLPTLMTLAVLAIALALPGFLYTGLKNLQQLSAGWEGEPRISLYLQQKLNDDDADRFSRTLLLWDELAAVELTSKEQGLLEFRQLSGLGDVLDYLNSNPLPAVITVIPRDISLKNLPLLQARLQELPEVDEAVLDMEWLQRLNGFIGVAERVTFVLALLLMLTVLLVIGNTVRLSIESRRDEIVVSKLVGATDAWVRRPFLYTGAWYGVLGALLAWVIIHFSLLMLKTPVEQLAQLYQSNFEPLGLGLVESLCLLLVSLLLGGAGALIAVGRHLSDAEPR